MIFERKILQRIFKPKKKKKNSEGGYEIGPNREFRTLLNDINIVTTLKSQRLRRVGLV